MATDGSPAWTASAWTTWVDGVWGVPAPVADDDVTLVLKRPLARLLIRVLRNAIKHGG
jgi:hypothetical protein